MDLTSNKSIRAALYALLPDGDLVAVADEMRRNGIESLLLCRPDGGIAKVLTEHRVRRLAQPPPHVRTGVPFIPEQATDIIPVPEPSPEGEGVGAPAG